jgi:hypothetical protein
MPTFEIQAPDGRKFRITAPDGATPEQVQSQLSAMVGSQSGEGAPAQPEDTRPAMARFAAGAGKSFTDLALGARQRVGSATQQEVDEKLKAEDPLMKTPAGKFGNFAGNVAATLPAAFVPGGQSLLGATLLGGGFGFLQPTRTGENPAANAVVGGAASLAGQGLFNLLGRAINPIQAPKLNAEQSALIRLAEQKGIPLTAGQQTQSRPLMGLESVLSKMPFTSGKAETFRQGQQAGLNRALLGTMGQQGDELSTANLGAAKDRIGGEFNRLSSQNDLKVTLPFLQRLSVLKGEVDSKQTEDVARIVKNYISDIESKITQNGTIPGTFYKSVDSKIGRQAFNTSNGDLKTTLKDLQGIVRQQMDNSIAPADQAAWKDARSQWSSLKTVGNAVRNDASGEAFPGRLAQSVRKSDEAGMLYGKGRTELPELAKLANGLLKDSIPNSGTPERLFWQGLMESPTSAAQIVKLLSGAAGATIGQPLQSMLLSEAGRKYLSNGLIGQGAPIRQAAPYAGALMRGGAPAFLLTGNGVE